MAVILLALLALALFWPAMAANFAYEDWAWVAESDPTRGTTWSRFLTNGTYWLQGGDPLMIHLGNLALHLACAALVLSIARRWSRGAGLVAYAALLLSPLASFAVNYASARSELLIALFALLAVRFSSRWVWAACAVGLALTKDAALPMAGVLVLGLVAQTGLAGLVLVLGALLAIPRLPVITMFGLASLRDTLGLLGTLAAGALVPAGLSFDPDPAGLSAWWAVAGVLVLAILAREALRWRLLPWLLLAQWLPRVVIGSGDTPQPHHAYLLCAGLALGAGYLWHLLEDDCAEVPDRGAAGAGAGAAWAL